MLIAADDAQAAAILGALRAVADGGRAADALDGTDTRALAAFDRYILRHAAPLDIAAVHDVAPADLARLIVAPDDRLHVVQFLIVMALTDGAVDPARIGVVRAFAGALGVDDDAVHDLTELGRGNLAWVRADAQRQNLRSITGRNLDVPIDAWILPYRDGHADPALATRYQALRALPVDTVGRTFFEFYQANGFAFPGETAGVNERFAMPHDTSHVLSGYDTSPQGELLVSTFTAGMHPKEPMAGHILPVIISWHLGIELVKFAGETTGSLDPPKFWNAWERGSGVTTDMFADGWTLWSIAGRSLDDVRQAYCIAPLDATLAAAGKIPVWYRPSA